MSKLRVIARAQPLRLAVVPYRKPSPEPALPATVDALTAQIAAGSISTDDAKAALALIVAREQLGPDASDSDVEGLARETAELLDGDPMLGELLRP